VIFAGVWYFLIRRLQGQQTGFMTLGKNKAKIYMENEVDVTFKDAAGVDEVKQELVEVIDFLKNRNGWCGFGEFSKRGRAVVIQKKLHQCWYGRF
jgi:cell division protease FtsH